MILTSFLLTGTPTCDTITALEDTWYNGQVNVLYYTIVKYLFNNDKIATGLILFTSILIKLHNTTNWLNLTYYTSTYDDYSTNLKTYYNYLQIVSLKSGLVSIESLF
jgi:hypothetical protein